MSFTFGSDALLAEFCRDQEVEGQFTLEADLNGMLAFERALAEAEAGVGMMSGDDARRIGEAIRRFTADIDGLKSGFRRDGVAPPALVAQIRATLPTDLREKLHWGTTSQDLIDSSLMIRLKRVIPILAHRLDDLQERFRSLASRHSNARVLQARTRMQNALPISVPEKVENWMSPLARLSATTPHHFPLQLGGPEGACRVMADHRNTIADAMAKTLNLDAPGRHWQTDRQPLLTIAFWLTRAASVMGKIAQDILIMGQSDIGEVRLVKGGRSSAMSHKANPVLAEVIVAQAHWCHAQMSGLETASIHENERSGTAWTLEWLLLPGLAVMSGSALANMQALAGQITFASGEGPSSSDADGL